MIGPQVFQTKDAPRYRVGFTVHLAFYVAQIIVFFVLRVILTRRNKLKVEAAKAEGRAEGEVNLDHAFDGECSTIEAMALFTQGSMAIRYDRHGKSRVQVSVLSNALRDVTQGSFVR
jgi:hypothetical protein